MTDGLKKIREYLSRITSVNDIIYIIRGPRRSKKKKKLFVKTTNF